MGANSRILKCRVQGHLRRGPQAQRIRDSFEKQALICKSLCMYVNTMDIFFLLTMPIKQRFDVNKAYM